MLPAEPEILLGRQGFADAQAGMAGAHQIVGFYQLGWYGTDTDDERGSFGVVNAAGPLLGYIGDFLNLEVAGRSVYVYIIGSKTNLLTGVGEGSPLDLAVTRRTYLAVANLAIEPVRAKVSLVA